MKKLLVILIFFVHLLSAQAQDKVAFSGYLSDMQSQYRIPIMGWQWQNQFQNRLNAELYPFSWLSASLQVRSRFINGSPLLVQSAFSGGDDPGLLDMNLSGSGSWNSGPAYGWSVMIDRAWLEFTFGKLVIKTGRQRINWGQTFVWNPNDLFNTYSFFDFDYPERPGSDAVLLQYYTGNASDVELAVKADSAGKITAAGYFRFNVKGFDVQVLGGILSEEEVAAGLGWSGTLSGVSFRGEAGYFRNLSNFRDSAGVMMLSLSMDYTFSNSLFLQGEVLYSGFAKKDDAANLFQYYSGALDVRKIGFTPWSIYTGITYPLSPLLSGTLSAIVYPAWKGFYFGPTFDLSLSDNLYLSLIGQVFSLETTVPPAGTERQNYLFAFLRAKWNF